jgi:hypothetical protein
MNNVLNAERQHNADQMKLLEKSNNTSGMSSLMEIGKLQKQIEELKK